ncbi:hypothetical protein BDZ89DRAFT_1147682 [Hymenopellis radicata]|nr:hypothetical protein BDZ89DRAFT_1147682 [Hymenopellis radicata]
MRPPYSGTVGSERAAGLLGGTAPRTLPAKTVAHSAENVPESDDDLNVIDETPSPSCSPSATRSYVAPSPSLLRIATHSVTDESNADHREEVHQRAEQLEQLVADFADSTIPSYNKFLQLAQETGASIIAAREEHHDGSAPSDPDLAAQQAEQQAALKEAAWAALGARLDAAAGKFAAIVLQTGIDIRVRHIADKAISLRPHPHIWASKRALAGAMERVLGRGENPLAPRWILKKLDELVHFLQVYAIEKSTRKGYATGARDYARFCKNHHLPLDPTSETLSRYIAYTSRYIKSAPKYLTGAKHFIEEFYPDFAANQATAAVQATIRGANKMRADPIQRKPPLRTHHLQSALNQANATNIYDDLLFAPILSCGFYACHRAGELTMSNDKSLCDWRKVIKRASLHFTKDSAGYTLPYHKGNPLYHGTAILFIDQEVASPLKLLKRYVRRSDKLHGARAALFVKEDGSRPTKSWFDTKLS